MLTVMKRTIMAATVVLFLTCLSLVSFVPFSKADFEAPEIQWDETYCALEGYSVVQTVDGGYIIAGQQADFREFQPHLLSGWENYTAWLIKVAASGNIEWNRTYGKEVGGGRRAYSVIQTTDSGYSIFGLRPQVGENNAVFIIKTDSNGDIQWNTTISWSGRIERFVGTQTNDGGYLVAGSSAYEEIKCMAWVIKVDENGISLWNRTFGNFESTQMWTVRARAVAEADDGGCIVAGHWETDCWFAKTDANGNLQWNQTYDLQFDDDFSYYTIHSIVQAVDGGYIFAGDNDYRAFIVKTNSEGIMEWNRSYADESEFTSIVQSTDGEGYFAVGGFSVPYDKSLGAWFVKLDVSGNLMWNTTYRLFENVNKYTSAQCVIKTSDGGYAVAGTLEDNVWLVKFAPDYVAPPDDDIPPDGDSPPDTDDLPEDDSSVFSEAWFVTTIICSVIVVANLIIYFKKIKRQH
jgi:hypothetical protein